MLLTKSVKVIIGGKNIKKYREKGYSPIMYKELDVKIEDLTKGSNVMVDVQCDYCDKSFKLTYKSYNLSKKRTIQKDSCQNCIGEKIRESNIKNYDVPNVMHVDKIKNKIPETMLARYGVISSSQMEGYKEKTEKTCMERYGVTNYSKTEESKERRKQTCLDRYGVESYTQTDECKEKTKETCLNRYGVEHVANIKGTREKYINTCLEKYGTINYFQTEEFKEKCKNTMLEKYGSENFSSTEIFSQKTLETWKKKTREEIDEILSKRTMSLYNNGTQKCSKEQMKLYKMLYEEYEEVYLNYPLKGLSLDVLLIKDGVRIDIEYDGWYWHKDSGQRDFQRDYNVRSDGYKILRVRSAGLLPSIEDLKEKIDELVETDRYFTRITLEDWRDVG